ncbi:sugar porter family MFS transporter [Curtobacterium sp. Leaf261]|uniref:sugar porter family MFS transporter n=1 Tax=Curtobacterium sp. Leaf261 TaxID=1736311 RepID=UPI0006FA8C08|nr:MFS transporter [Curtobacterium sp. Leaf261]
MTTTDVDPAGPTTLPPLTDGPHRKRLGVVALVATFGGLLFGYDTSVVNGAISPMADELHLTAVTEGWVTSALLFGAAVGAVAGGRLSDVRGRRWSIMLMAVLFLVGTVVCVAAPTFGWMVVGRAVLGLAVGGASTIVPVYLAELAPFEVRGSIAGRNELAIVAGQLAAFVVNAVIGSVWGDIVGVWRIMLAVEALPAIALFVGMVRMPESPRWLVVEGRVAEAVAVLHSIRSPERAEAEVAQVVEATGGAVGPGSSTWTEILRNRWLVRILLVGIGLGVAQQLTGINAIMYYGQIVLTESGFSASAALIANVGPGVIAVIGAVIALRMIDRCSRRRTFVTGFTLTTVSHLLIGIGSLALPEGDPARPWVILFLVVLFVGSMQTFLSVAVWVTLSEIFPLRMRAFGMGVSVFCLWIANALLGLSFPSVLATLGITGSFFGFAVLNALALWFVWRAVPETRGRTLEQLEQDVAAGAIHQVRGH